jgi:hypothetical protein
MMTNMNTTITYQRNPMGGNDLAVQVSAGQNEQISRVVVELDGFTLNDDVLEEPEESYQNEFRGAGSAAPGTSHLLRVTAYDTDNAPHVASRRWQDLR